MHEALVSNSSIANEEEEGPQEAEGHRVWPHGFTNILLLLHMFGNVYNNR